MFWEDLGSKVFWVLLIVELVVLFASFYLGYFIGVRSGKKDVFRAIVGNMISMENPDWPVRYFKDMYFYAVPYGEDTKVKVFESGVRIRKAWKRVKGTNPVSVRAKSDSSIE